jgi:hypothetical protein
VDRLSARIAIGVSKEVKRRMHFYSVLLAFFWIHVAIILSEAMKLFGGKLHPLVFWCGLIIGIPIVSVVLTYFPTKTFYTQTFTSKEKYKARLTLALISIFDILFIIWYLKSKVYN